MEPATFRVATYNIRKSVGLDWRRRPDRILTVLEELAPDIVALQEVDKRFGTRQSTLPEEALNEAGWIAAHFAREPESLGWRGNAILVRRPIRVETARSIELPAFEPRGAAVADLAMPAGALRVVGMHLGLTGKPRIRQIAAIASELEHHPSRPTILMGDTNEWRALTGCLARFHETHHVSPPMPTFHTALPLAALDRIVTTRDVHFHRCEVHVSPAARKASDHLPLWADLALRAA
jgi:endonuclease/exonuclease/phosphatase family metal-dependent hydrolase